MQIQEVILPDGSAIPERRLNVDRRKLISLVDTERRKKADRRINKPYANALAYDDILNAFTPAIEIHDAEHFVGRREEIKSAITGLIAKGSFIVVHGQRGVGKSSIANQISAIAKGDTELTSKLHLNSFLPRKTFNYKVLKYVVDTSVNNISLLSERVLYGDGASGNSLIDLTNGGNRKLASIARSKEENGALGLPQIANISNKESESRQYDIQRSEDAISVFRQSLKEAEENIAEKYDGLLILIDEFDLIKNKSGFGSIIKACSSHFVKFAIVAVGSTINEIIKDHTSVTRKKQIIHIDIMDQVDLEDILINAQRIIGNEIIFSGDLVKKILDHSDGFPYFTQLIGQSVMANAYERGSKLATHTDLDKFFDDLLNYKLETLFNEQYRERIEGKLIRKNIITLASQISGETFTTKKLRSVDSSLKSATIRKEMNILAKPELNYEPILVRIRTDEYRFMDPLFKTFCRLRKERDSR